MHFQCKPYAAQFPGVHCTWAASRCREGVWERDLYSPALLCGNLGEGKGGNRGMLLAVHSGKPIAGGIMGREILGCLQSLVSIGSCFLSPECSQGRCKQQMENKVSHGGEFTHH